MKAQIRSKNSNTPILPAVDRDSFAFFRERMICFKVCILFFIFAHLLPVEFFEDLVDDYRKQDHQNKQYHGNRRCVPHLIPVVGIVGHM